MTTHPTGGAGSGPGRNLLALLDFMRRSRARSATAAAESGQRGRSASPLTDEQRADRYRRQAGTDRLTPRQRRRITHKAHRAATRQAA